MEVIFKLKEGDYDGPVIKSFTAQINNPLRLRTKHILEPLVAYLVDNIDPQSVYYLTLKIPYVEQEAYLGYVPATTRLRFPYKKEELPKIIADELELVIMSLTTCQEVENLLLLGWDKPLRQQKPKLRKGLYTLIRKWGKANFDALGILYNYEVWQFYLSVYGISNLEHFFKDLDTFAKFTPGSAEVAVYTPKFSDIPKTLRFRELKDFLGGEYVASHVRE